MTLSMQQYQEMQMPPLFPEEPDSTENELIVIGTPGLAGSDSDSDTQTQFTQTTASTATADEFEYYENQDDMTEVLIISDNDEPTNQVDDMTELLIIPDNDEPTNQDEADNQEPTSTSSDAQTQT